MKNIVYIEYSSDKTSSDIFLLRMPIESLIVYCIYKYCASNEVELNFVRINKPENMTITVSVDKQAVKLSDFRNIPWQVASCMFPVAIYDDLIITGLCAVARHICKYRTSLSSAQEHTEGLLGFRKGCLQAPNEVSIWTKFCEIEVLDTVNELLQQTTGDKIPESLVRFENHLKKPVKVHNVYKIARELKKVNLSDKTFVDNKSVNNKEPTVHSGLKDQLSNQKAIRVSKNRKWKSNDKNKYQIDSSMNIEDLEISHQYAEGPFLTLADLILLPSYYLLFQFFEENTLKSLLPITHKWYNHLMTNIELNTLTDVLNGVLTHQLQLTDCSLPETDNVSLYKTDPKRYNPKKRLFTKESDIEDALSAIIKDMEINVVSNNYNFGIVWNEIPDGANPNAGHLPDERMERKSQQLENLALAVQEIAKDGNLIVDFCSGSGHLGILLAYLLPKCTIILLENKEQSLLRARKRVHEMGMNNVFFFQCNLDFFIGRFDIGIALHACGVASDLVLDKCLKAKAKFVLCPCCYGSLHTTERLVYPRSHMFSSLPVDKYLCIGHAADQTHADHPLAVRGARCMAVIDSDRGRLAEESGYTVTLTRLKPLSCTPKNNLLVGVIN